MADNDATIDDDEFDQLLDDLYGKGGVPLGAADSSQPSTGGESEAAACGQENTLSCSSLKLEDVNAWQERLARALDANEDIMLDLQQIEAIDTAGMQLLLALQTAASAQNRAITCSSPPSAELQRVCRLLGLDETMTIFKSEGNECHA